MSTIEKLGRFGHHPDPAIDFCVEVEVIEGEAANISVGFTNGTPSVGDLLKRAERALEFRVGGDLNCIDAKQTLRRVVDGLSPARSDNFPNSFQSRVHPWMLACFGSEIASDKLERGDRFLEEDLELLQSGDYPEERAHALIKYVYGRPKGEPRQEVGGVMVTLAAYCLAHGLDMHEAGEVELARVWTKVDAIRAKQAAKPTGSALPIAIGPTPLDRLPDGHTVLEQADLKDSRVSQTVRVEATGEEYERIVHCVEAYGFDIEDAGPR